MKYLKKIISENKKRYRIPLVTKEDLIDVALAIIGICDYRQTFGELDIILLLILYITLQINFI